ncbi:hypothetical protein AB4Z10_27165 [Bosea sp. RAF48]|uniref:hypothetical protein n=1 Tax=Bosea sp. RAF48 TaxID=3237480 RepID=UPI003F92BB57
MLAFEAQQAVWLRSMKIAAGGRAAERESRLMVSEKVSTAQAAVLKAVTGTGLSELLAAIDERSGRMFGDCRGRFST